MNLTKSSAIEPKRHTWEILAKRFKRSKFNSQDKWMDDCLIRHKFNPKEWMKTGEFPSEMICRFASEKGKDINAFLLEIMK